jgi:hypothetical protein
MPIISAVAARMMKRGIPPIQMLWSRRPDSADDVVQYEQSSWDCQQQEKNDRESVLPGRAQPKAASYGCQNAQERHRCNNSVDAPEEPKPKLHGQL